MAAPAKATSGRDFDPISSSCRNNSRNSNGGVTAARTTRQKNIPRSPNHSKNSLIRPLEELTVGDMSTVRGHRKRWVPCLRPPLNFRSITDLNPDWARRARLFRCMRVKQGVGSAIEELQSDVPAHISQQAVVAHPKCILGVVAAGIPAIDGRHRAGIRRDERREREDAVAVFAAARRQGRNHGMAQPRKHAFALTAVVQRVFPEGFRQRIARRRAYRCDAKVRSESLAVALSALLPLRRGVIRLADASRERCAGSWIRAERVEEVVAGASFSLSDACRSDLVAPGLCLQQCQRSLLNRPVLAPSPALAGPRGPQLPTTKA